MKTFKEWMTIAEGMSVHVSGYSWTDDIHDFDGLAYQIKRKVIETFWQKLTPDQQQAVRKSGSMNHGILTPDGSHYGREKAEIINFYTGGWPEDMVPQMVKGIKYYLDEMKVKYGAFKQEKSGMFDSGVIRIPILAWSTTKDAPPELSLNNGNANLIFGDLLGYRGSDSSYEMSAADLYTKISNLDPDKLGIHARDPYSSKTAGGPQVFHGGLDSDGIERRLEVIKNIAKWAIEHHYDKIYVA